MSLVVKCDCGKSYKVPDERAGQKIRCKECGGAIAIPAPQPARVAETSEWNDDWNEDNAVDESAPPPRRDKPKKKPKADRDTEFMPPARTLSSTSDAYRQAEEQSHTARNAGFGMLTTGALILILPFFGLQLRMAANMPPEGSMIVGGILALLGLIALGASTMITVAPASPKSSSRRGRAADDDDDDEEESARVVNPGEKVAKVFLWTVLIVMLSIPAFIFFLVFLGFALIFWRITLPLFVLGVPLAIAGLIYWRRTRSARRSGRSRRQRADEDDDDPDD